MYSGLVSSSCSPVLNLVLRLTNWSYVLRPTIELTAKRRVSDVVGARSSKRPLLYESSDLIRRTFHRADSLSPVEDEVSRPRDSLAKTAFCAVSVTSELSANSKLSRSGRSSTVCCRAFDTTT